MSDTKHTPVLVLSARIERENPRHAHVGVFQDGAKAGILIVDAEHAELIVGLLNAATDLFAACERTTAWLERLAKRAESQAEDCQFSSLRDACIADAKNYRATAADIQSAIDKAKERQCNRA